MTKKQKRFYRDEIASIPRFEMSPEELDEIMDIILDAYDQGAKDAFTNRYKGDLSKCLSS